MRKRTFLLVALALSFLVALYVSPYVSIRNLRRAADAGDSVALADHVDFPAVRESLKASLAQGMTDRISKGLNSNLISGLGTMLVNTLVGRFVDQMVTPRGIAALLTKGHPANDDGAGGAPSADPSASTSAQDSSSGPKVVRGYRGWDRFEVRLERVDGQAIMVATLRRENLFFWKLKGILLPLGGPVP